MKGSGDSPSSAVDRLGDLRRHFKGSILENVAIGPTTVFAAGGSARYLFTPADEADVVVLVPWMVRNGIAMLHVRPGANLLVDDAGYQGGMIDLRKACGSLSYRPGAGEARLVTAGAGARVAELADFCIRNGIAGMERYAGIGGSVGGALVDKRGELPAALLASLVEVRVLGNDGIVSLSSGEGRIHLGKEKRERRVILSATFEFRRGETAELMRVRRRELVRRAQEEALNAPRAGSVFHDEPDISASELLRKAGCAGIQNGNAAVMESVPNMVTHDGRATAADLYGMIVEMRRRVKEHTGRSLFLRVRLAGFPGMTMAESQ